MELRMCCGSVRDEHSEGFPDSSAAAELRVRLLGLLELGQGLGFRV